MRLAEPVLSSERLSAPASFRSAVPLAAAAIACLALVPTLGGPGQPLHWAMTVGLVSFGGLLWARHRLSRREEPLAGVPVAAARAMGRAVLLITAVSALIVVVIIAAGIRAHVSLSALSLVMPAAGLSWLGAIGLKILRYQAPEGEVASAGDRPSRRPPPWQNVPSRATSSGAPPNHHLSA